MHPPCISSMATVVLLALAFAHCWTTGTKIELAPPGKRSEPCWVFTHMQKSGGSTVKEMLFKRYGWRHGKTTVYNTAIWRGGQEKTDLFVKEFMDETWDVLYGSAVEAMRDSTQFVGECKWFTIFRHPISRLVSAYFYCKRTPHDILCARPALKATNDIATSFELVDFARHWGNYGLRQFSFGQVSASEVLGAFARGDLKVPGGLPWNKTESWYLLKLYLDNRVSVDSFLARDERMAMYDLLRPIQDLIGQRYAAVGILEEFNTTLALFDATLDIPDMNWQEMYGSMEAANTNSKNKAMERQVLEEALTNTEIKSYIQLDLLLYEHAKTVFSKQARMYGLQ